MAKASATPATAPAGRNGAAPARKTSAKAVPKAAPEAPPVSPEAAAPAAPAAEPKRAAKTARSRKPEAAVTPPGPAATPVDAHDALPAPTAAPAAPGPSREQRVREAAYHRWLARGMADGDHERDWLDAEREVDGDSHPA